MLAWYSDIFFETRKDNVAHVLVESFDGFLLPRGHFLPWQCVRLLRSRVKRVYAIDPCLTCQTITLLKIHDHSFLYASDATRCSSVLTASTSANGVSCCCILSTLLRKKPDALRAVNVTASSA